MRGGEQFLEEDMDLIQYRGLEFPQGMVSQSCTDKSSPRTMNLLMDGVEHVRGSRVHVSGLVAS